MINGANPIHNIAHPLWALLRLLILMLSLALILLMTSRHFDETEIKALVWAFLAAAGLEMLPPTLKKLSGQ